MDKECVVCGRAIRSGWKYCYEHRNYKNEGKHDNSMPFVLLFMFFAAIVFSVTFIGKENLAKINNILGYFFHPLILIPSIIIILIICWKLAWKSQNHPDNQK